MTSHRRLVVEVSAQARNWALPAQGLERLEVEGPPGWEVLIIDEEVPFSKDAGHIVTSSAIEAAGSMEAYFGWGIAEPVFRAAPHLRWVHAASAGVGNSLFPAMRSSDVRFTNAAGVTSDSIAEFAVGGILHFLRGFDLAQEQQRRATWDKVPFSTPEARVREVCECRAVIVGSGGLGEAIATRLKALGAAHVTGVRRRLHLPVSGAFDQVIALDALDASLSAADIVVLAAPLTPATNNLLSRARLDCLSPGAIVVNVSRGALLDEEALAEKLARGQIRGAVLDVFREEPLPAASPFWGLRNALVTPHVAHVSPQLFWRRSVDLFLDNWQRYERGEPLRNLVDKEAGY
jgi:phosphoglycerate dehydrogenase-like enzyme